MVAKRSRRQKREPTVHVPPSEWDVLKGYAEMAEYIGVELRTFQRWVKRGLIIPGNPRPICTRGELMQAIRNMKNGEK